MTVAYLDPGAGGILVSAVVGGAAGIGVVASRARARLGFGRKRKGQGTELSAEDAPGDGTSDAAPTEEAAPAEASAPASD
jgi:hypothetical protein